MFSKWKSSRKDGGCMNMKLAIRQIMTRGKTLNEVNDKHFASLA
jgi:hypothetical protein